MKLHYYPETDSLYIELRSEPGTETREIADGLNVDLNEMGQVVGFDIDHASTHRSPAGRGRNAGGAKTASLCGRIER